MRRPSFARWIKRECLRISGEKTFSLKSLAARVQRPSNSVENVLSAGLQLYAIANQNEENLSELLWDESLREEFEAAQTAISGRSLEQLALRGTPLRSLPESHREVLARFYEDYHEPERIAETKLQLCRESQVLLRRTAAQYAPISEATGIAVPNISSYLKHESVGKVTLDGARAIRDYLLEFDRKLG